jgi:diguanylate cyclase
MTFRFSSLRTALLLPFVGLVIAVASAIGGLSYVTGVRAVEDFSNAILRDVTHRVGEATAKHLSTPKTALQTVAPDEGTLFPGASGIVSEIAAHTFPAIEQRLWLATGVFSDVSGYIYFGATDGRFIGVSRGAAGTEVRVKDAPDKLRTAFRSSGPGLRGDAIRQDNFDPRMRPWYKAATAANSLTWSPIYVSTTSKALTLTLAKPVLDSSKRIIGVIATDLPLTSLNEFVRTLETSQNGVVFIVDSQGELVASSVSESLVLGDAKRLKANASTNALIRDAYAAFTNSRKNGNASASGIVRSQFESQLGTADLAATPQNEGAGLDWTMLVAMPRADHMDGLRKTVVQNIAIGLLAVAAAILLGLWFTQRIARDVTRLSEATRLLASGRAPGLARSQSQGRDRHDCAIDGADE